MEETLHLHISKHFLEYQSDQRLNRKTKFLTVSTSSFSPRKGIKGKNQTKTMKVIYKSSTPHGPS